ncbi:hypothetical protein GCM10017752_18600 [Streptomyces roseoviridis]
MESAPIRAWTTTPRNQGTAHPGARPVLAPDDSAPIRATSARSLPHSGDIRPRGGVGARVRADTRYCPFHRPPGARESTARGAYEPLCTSSGRIRTD